MVGGDHEHRATTGPESLRHRHARPSGKRSALQQSRAALQLDLAAAIDHRHANAVAAGASTCIHHAKIADRPGRIQGRHELRQRRVLVDTVVLDFHQRRDIGPQRLHHRHQLALLFGVMRRSLRAALGRKTTAAAIAVEQVQQVEAGDAHVARHRGHLGTRRLGDVELVGELQPILAAPLVEHAGDAAQHAAHAQRMRIVERLRQEPQGVWILAGAVVVEQQQATRVVLLHDLRGRAGQGDFGGLEQAAAETCGDFAIAGHAAVAGDGQRRGDAQWHAFIALPIIGMAGRLGNHDRFDLAATDDFDHRITQGGQRRALVAELDNATRHTHAITLVQLRFGIALVLDEDAFGGQRVAIVALGLDENALQSLREIASHHAFHRYLLVEQRAGGAPTLHFGNHHLAGHGHVATGGAVGAVGGGRIGRGLAGRQRERSE